MRLRLEYRRYSLPFRVPVRTSHGVWAERDGVIVRLTNVEETGGKSVVGYGEAAPIPWFGTESVDEVEAALGALGEWVTAEQLEAVPERLGCLRFALASARAAGGLSEPTRADADGARASSRPTAERDREVPAPTKSTGDAVRTPYLPVAALLPAGRATLTAIAPKVELGFRTFKWKVGVGDPADELALLDDLIAALPEGAKLRLDANGAWDARTASRWLERAADRPVEFIEQPCFAPASDGSSAVRKIEDVLRGLSEDFPTPIGLDESLVGANDIGRWLAAGWRGVWVVKPALIGDLQGALGQLERARADVVFSSALETSVGARAALQAAFAWRPAEKPRALGFGVWPLFQNNVFDGPFAAPFVRVEDVDRLNPEAVWNALT